MCVYFISFMSDRVRADWGKRKVLKAEFGLNVGYGLGGVRSGRHRVRGCYIVCDPGSSLDYRGVSGILGTGWLWKQGPGRLPGLDPG